MPQLSVFAGTHCAYLLTDGQAELTEMVYPSAEVSNPSTNPALINFAEATNDINKIITPCSRLSTVRGQPQHHAH